MAHGTENPNGAGHEHKEADVRLILYTVVGLVLSVVVVCLVVWGAFNIFKFQAGGSAQRLNAFANPAQLPPEPRLLVHPWEQLQQLRAREDDILNNYRWVDQKNGVVHIPIEKAMEQVVGTLPS